MKVCSLWVGEKLSYIESLSMISAIAVGHDVDLYVYDDVKNAPKHVNVKDASEVMSRDLLIKCRRTESPAVGADIFRLMLQQQSRGCYIDCDMVLLRPLPDEDYIFGWESGHSINNAVLRLPPDSPILTDMLALALSRPIVPPWFKRRLRVRQWGKWLFGRDTCLNAMPWGTIGPYALTHYAHKHGLAHKAKPIEVFYPVRFNDAVVSLLDPVADLKAITSNTIGVHLWHSKLALSQHLEPFEGCWLKEQCRRLGVADPRWFSELKRVA